MRAPHEQEGPGHPTESRPLLSPLFTQVRGSRILRSSDAGSCIDGPPEARGWSKSASTTAGRDLHVVVLDKDAGRRIGREGQLRSSLFPKLASHSFDELITVYHLGSSLTQGFREDVVGLSTDRLAPGDDIGLCVALRSSRDTPCARCLTVWAIPKKREYARILLS